MYEFLNLNPKHLYTGDCVVRAISKVLDQPWETTYLDIADVRLSLYRMPSDNGVWGEYLKQNGFTKHFIYCHECYTVREFVEDYPRGSFVLGVDGHAIAVIDGTYYDTSDSGDECVIYYWQK